MTPSMRPMGMGWGYGALRPRTWLLGIVTGLATLLLHGLIGAQNAEAHTPPAPTDLTLVRELEGRSITITLGWEAPTGEDIVPIYGYRVDVSYDNKKTWTILKDDPDSNAREVPGYVHTGSWGGRTAHYRVRASNSNGAGQWGEFESVSTPAVTPDPPMNVSTTPTSKTSITISWDAPEETGGPEILNYKVEWSATMDGMFVELTNGRVPFSITSVVDSGLSVNTTRYYRVTARNGALIGDGFGAPSTPIMGSTLPDTAMVSFVADNYAVDEGGTVTVQIEFTQDLTVNQDVPIVLETQSSAKAGVHYTALGSNPIIPVRATMDRGMLMIQTTDVLGDAAQETVTIVLSLGNLSHPLSAGMDNQQTTITIRDDDEPEVTVAFAVSENIEVTEGGMKTIGVTLALAAAESAITPEREITIPIMPNFMGGATAADFTFPMQVTFAADATEASLTQLLTFTATDDEDIDPGESIELSLNPTEGDGVTTRNPATATVNLVDNEIPVTLAAVGPMELQEGGVTDLVVTATIADDMTAPTSPLTVPIVVTFVTADVDDFGVLSPTNLTIAAGQRTGTVVLQLPVAEDNAIEEAETFQIAADIATESPYVGADAVDWTIGDNTMLGAKPRVEHVRSMQAQFVANTANGSVGWANSGSKYVGATLSSTSFSLPGQSEPVSIAELSYVTARQEFVLVYGNTTLPADLNRNVRLVYGDTTVDFGMATHDAASKSLTVPNVTAGPGTAPFTLSIMRRDELPTFPDFDNLVGTEGVAVTWTLPNLETGNLPVPGGYSFNFQQLPPGLSFSGGGDTLTISGTPTAARSAETFSLRGTDADADDFELSFTITINEDNTPPAVVNPIRITSSPMGANNNYLVGETIAITVTFDETVRVTTGTDLVTLALTLGTGTVNAEYKSGSDSTELVFHYTVVAGDAAPNGISVATDAISVPASREIEDLFGNNVGRTVSHAALSAQATHAVDAVGPTITNLAIVSPAPSAMAYGIGNEIAIAATFSEAVVVGGAPVLDLVVGTATKTAVYDENHPSGTAANTMVFTYTVNAGDADTDGVDTAANPIRLPTAGTDTIADVHGNTATLTHAALAANTAHAVDGVRPTVLAVAITSNPGSDGFYIPGDTIAITVTFDETVRVTTSTDPVTITLTLGTDTVNAEYKSGSDSTNLVFHYSVAAGDAAPNGVAGAADAINVPATREIEDLAGNNIGRTVSHAALPAQASHAVDAVGPTLTNLAIVSPAPSAMAYGIGNEIAIAATFSEAVVVGGAPVLDLVVGTATKTAAYDENHPSGTAANTMVFTYTVNAGDADTDGVDTAANPIRLPTAGTDTIADVHGNTATLTHAALAANTAHTVDGVQPTVLAVAITSEPGSDGFYIPGDTIAVTVTYNETVTVVGQPTIQLEVGSTQRTATYAEGSGTTAIVFEYTSAREDQDADGLAVVAGSIVLTAGPPAAEINDPVGNDAVLSHPASAAAPTQVVIAVPNQPTDLETTAGEQRITLSWTAPTDAGGNAITEYAVQESVDGTATSWADLATVGGDISTYVHENLRTAQTVHYRVAARNAAGLGDYSSGVQGQVELGAATAPQNLTATGGESDVVLVWQAPAEDGGSVITGYRVEVSPNGNDPWTQLGDIVSASTLTATDSPRTEADGVRYYRVVAINAEGESPPSNAVRASAVVAITSIEFGAASYDVTEGSTVTVQVLLNLSLDAETRVTVAHQNAGTASTLMDTEWFLGNSGNTDEVIFPVGHTVATIIVSVPENDKDEDAANETRSLVLEFTGLESNDKLTAGTQSTTTIHIMDNDDPTVTVSFTPLTAEASEAGTVPATIMVNLAVTAPATAPERDLTISIVHTPEQGATVGDYTVNVTQVTFAATATGADLSQPVVITPVNDGDVDPNETVELSFSTTLPEDVEPHATDTVATVTIRDDEIPVTLTAVPGTIAEGAGTVDVVITATVGALAPNRTAALPITLAVTGGTNAGQAELDTDFTVVGTLPSITIDSAETTANATVRLTVLEDSTAEPAEMFTVTGSSTVTEAVVAGVNVTIGSSTSAEPEAMHIRQAAKVLTLERVGMEIGWDDDNGFPNASLSSATFDVFIDVDGTTQKTTHDLAEFSYDTDAGELRFAFAGAVPVDVRNLTLTYGSTTLTFADATANEDGTVYTWATSAAPTENAQLILTLVRTSVAASFGTTTIPEQAWPVHNNVNVQLPEVEVGNQPATYAVEDTPPLPAGITWDATTRTLSGTPTAVGAAQEFTYTATDVDGDMAELTFEITVVVDTTAPTVTTVAITSDTSPYTEGESIQVDVTFNEDVALAGSTDGPTLSLQLGEDIVAAAYAGTVDGSFAQNLSFHYVVLAGQSAPAGVTVREDGLMLATGGTLKDRSDNDADLSFAAQTFAAHVVDMPDAGTLSLDSTTPNRGEMLTATLADADIVTGEMWRWFRSAVVVPRAWQEIVGADQATYTPQVTDVGQVLQVELQYSDPHGAHTLTAATTVPVAANVGPEFTSAPVARDLLENSKADTAFGLPITATDRNGDEVRYALRNDGDAASFAIDAATGRLSTVAGVNYNYESRTPPTYTVTVVATDEYDSTSEATATVTINLLDVPEENGTVTGLPTAPAVGSKLRPTVADGDGTPEDAVWQWQMRDAPGGEWQNIAHAGYREFAPRTTHVGSQLRVWVTYFVPGSNGREGLVSAPTGRVVAATTAPPDVPATYSLTLAENATPVDLTDLTPSAYAADPTRLTYEIVSGDDTRFEVTTEGVLQYIGTGEDFETLVADGTPPDRLWVEVADGTAVSFTLITITVTDANDPGVVTFAATSSFEVGGTVTAELADQDGDVGDVTWRWQRSVDGTLANIVGATRVTYALVAADVGNTLLAIAHYSDGQGTAQTATSAASAEVTARSDGNAAPAFQPPLAPGAVAHYTADLPENTNGSTTPVELVHATVTDEDVDEMLAYAITVGADADRFALVPTNTGVNLTYIGGGENFERDPQTHDLVIRVTDSKQLVAFASVRITVTNVPEVGTAMLDRTEPGLGDTLKATMHDDDGGITDVAWRWQWAMAGALGDDAWQDIVGATDATYEIMADDIGFALRAVVQYRDALTESTAALLELTTAPTAVVLDPTAESRLDINDDGAFTVVDATVLYYAIQHDALLGSGATDDPRGSAESREAFLAPYLATGEPVNDATLRELLAKANELVVYHTNIELDVNRDGQIGADDARIVYHALAFPDLLGDGRAGRSFEGVRRQLIGPYVARGMGTDEDRLEALQAVWQLLQ